MCLSAVCLICVSFANRFYLVSSVSVCQGNRTRYEFSTADVVQEGICLGDSDVQIQEILNDALHIRNNHKIMMI